MNKKLSALLLTLALLLAGCVEAPPEPTTAPPIETAAPTEAAETTAATEPALTDAPDFTVYDIDGKPVKLSEFEGKPVVLNFWASWCGPCKAEMPDFDETCKNLAGKVEFVMVNITDGTSETVASASGFIADAGYSFPVYYDTDLDAAGTYGISSIPTTFFINAEGKLVAYYTGAMSAATLAQGIMMIYQVTE